MKYLGYKGSGGLAHMLFQINNGVAISKHTNRTLIVETLHDAFAQDFKEYFTIPNCNYITPSQNSLPKNYNKSLLKYEGGLYYFSNGPKYTLTLDFINEFYPYQQHSPSNIINEDIIYYSWLNSSVTRSFDIKVCSTILQLFNKQKITKPYIGIHYRNTDMETNINTIIETFYKATINSNIKNVYIATDDFKAFSKFKDKLGNHFNVFQYTCPPNNEWVNIHYGNPNKKEVVMNALIDLYNLYYSDIFIPSPTSSYSNLVSIMRSNPKNCMFNS